MKKDISEMFSYLLGGVVVLSFFLLVMVLVFVEISATNEKIIYLAIGILGASFSQVVSYFYGSSKGSKEKTQHLNDLAKNKEIRN